ncbi:hypothetical protein [Burkholderia sp. HI2500]|uniref:hypothetical protein n=1 Tax=Burkholderia sp. HI2500 TaxID=2015358 RepID=UPI000B9213E8|nr:hypothetical protein [Burkholderia sp. HI2500]OXJ15757.1 hypothetical protein CFB45_03865 [Burkholderia sp. HI2500]
MCANESFDAGTGAHRINLFLGPWPAAEHAYYDALASAKLHDEEDWLTNSLISCDWAWCLPDRISADAGGDVYVSDCGNHTVLRIHIKSDAAVIAGQLGACGNRLGALPGGALNRPARGCASGTAAVQVPVTAAKPETHVMAGSAQSQP